jgi:hypothetical protein
VGNWTLGSVFCRGEGAMWSAAHTSHIVCVDVVMRENTNAFLIGR